MPLALRDLKCSSQLLLEFLLLLELSSEHGWMGGVLGDGMRKPSSQMSKSELGLALVPRVGDLAFSGWIYSETGSFNLVILQNYLFFFFLKNILD